MYRAEREREKKKKREKREKRERERDNISIVRSLEILLTLLSLEDLTSNGSTPDLHRSKETLHFWFRMCLASHRGFYSSLFDVAKAAKAA